MLILYEHPFALYCQKVLVALNELGTTYGVLEEQRDFDRAELAKLWPPASIPVLRDGDQGGEHSSATHPVLRRARPEAVVRQGDRGRPPLPSSVPTPLAGRLRPLPLTSHFKICAASGPSLALPPHRPGLSPQLVVQAAR